MDQLRFNKEHKAYIINAISDALNVANLLSGKNLDELKEIAFKVAKKDRVSLKWMLDSSENMKGYANSLVKYCLTNPNHPKS